MKQGSGVNVWQLVVNARWSDLKSSYMTIDKTFFGEGKIANIADPFISARLIEKPNRIPSATGLAESEWPSNKFARAN